jgi:hypothetical protein
MSTLFDKLQIQMKNGYEGSDREPGFISHDALNQIVTLSKLKYNLKNDYECGIQDRTQQTYIYVQKTTTAKPWTLSLDLVLHFLLRRTRPAYPTSAIFQKAHGKPR